MLGISLFIGGIVLLCVGAWILLLAEKLNVSDRVRLAAGLGTLFLGAIFILILFKMLM